jgi:tRNA (adenine57-N1/adenine58-N1)-methyltransferase catalytic subunit
MRTIGASGHLWSYEFHETRANKARQEFLRHGLSDRVTLTHRNVCKEGFTVTDTADARQSLKSRLSITYFTF